MAESGLRSTLSEWNRDVNQDQLIRVSEMKEWVEAEDGLHGRTDADFLLMFLRSCDFDLDLTQKTLRMYYENRNKYPQWCCNRDLNHPVIKAILQTKFSTALIEQNPTQPTVVITVPSRFENFSNDLDRINKISSVMLEVVARRRNCQLNGCVTLVDFKNSPWWLILKLFSVQNLTAFSNSFVFGVPVRTVALGLINASWLTSTIMKIFHPFIPSSFRNKVFCVSDWSKVGKIVPLENLPEEYGGSAGPMEIHEDAFLDEILAINDFLMDDEKFGYKIKEK